MEAIEPMEIDLLLLDKNSESETLELKESFSNEALETIVAFANAQGGILLIGVRDNGKVIGMTIGAGTLPEWANKIQTKIQPRILPSITIRKHDDRTVGVIIVERSHAPVNVDGRYFKRVGRTNQVMSNTEIEYRILASSKTSWDSQIEQHTTINDLNEQLIKQFIEDINRQKRRTVPNSKMWQEVLEKLKLLDDGKPTRAAILLFGKDVGRFHPLAYIKAGRFKSLTDIVDDIVFDGPLFEQLDKATIWFRDRLTRQFVINESVLSRNAVAAGRGAGSSVQRDTVWEYPIEAVREAVVNAICHRDYKADVMTTVRLFDNYLEISNAGTLPPDLTPADLLKKHKSYPHNILIAEAFYNTGIIEKWGSGTLQIAKAMKQQNLPIPQFDVTSANNFILTLYRGAAQMEIVLELKERQLSALEYLRSNQKLTNVQYQKLCGVSRATATRDLTDLVERSVLTKQGIGKSTWYLLNG
jgi:ATP-dependent DNA helicase RecG